MLESPGDPVTQQVLAQKGPGGLRCSITNWGCYGWNEGGTVGSRPCVLLREGQIRAPTTAKASKLRDHPALELR
jgi:hypothetical protein